MSSSDRLVSDYLDRLESELAGLPRAGRREVLDGIEAHIEEALAALEPGDEAGVRNMLDRVGEPAEIAAEAGDRFGPRRQKTTWREICALILLPFGGLVLPVIGWFAGVVCLWVSDAWTAREGDRHDRDPGWAVRAVLPARLRRIELGVDLHRRVCRSNVVHGW